MLVLEQELESNKNSKEQAAFLPANKVNDDEFELVVENSGDFWHALDGNIS